MVVQRLPCEFSGLLIIRPILALNTPFLLLPYRPSSDPSAARTFIRNYFNQSFDKGAPVSGDELMQELRLTEPMVRNQQSPGRIGEKKHMANNTTGDRSCAV